MMKTLLTLVLLLAQLSPDKNRNTEELAVKLTLRPSYERHDYFSAVPIAKIENEYTFMNRQGEFETIQLTLPKNELRGENGILEIYFTGGPEYAKSLCLVAGLKAIDNIYKEIEDHDLTIKGKIVGIAGNLQAIESNKRFIKQDLNRIWSIDKINSIIDKDKSLLEYEDLELFEIHELLESLCKEEFQQKILIDLHTTSADNGNFIVLPEKSMDYTLIRSLKLPMIMDLVQYIPGTLLDYMNHKDFISFAFEGGQIGSDQAVDLMTHGIWELMYQSGVIKPVHDFKELLHYEELIGSLHKPLPGQVTVLHRHKISEGDYFHMKPGYKNFHKIENGEILAKDKNGEIRSPFDGLIFMPLYQNIGNDGFFIVQEIA